MRIQLLRLREDFNEDFIASLSRFMSAKYNWQGSMYWCNRFGLFKKPKQHYFYTNDLLNLVYPSTLACARLTPFTKEFSYHPIFYRRWLQRLYVFWAVRIPLRWFVTSSILVIEDAPEDIENWVILPGNHCHRIIDIEKNISSVFAKFGFNPDFLKTDASVRLKYDFLPAPRVLEFNEEGLWYSEEVISGMPINRLANAYRKEAAIRAAESAISKLYRETSRSVDMNFYLNSLEEGLRLRICRLGDSVSSEQSAELLHFLRWLLGKVSRAGKTFKNITLVLSHGDFQAANILAQGNTIWLIDWEYSDIRSIYYDSICLHVNSRSYKGLARRLEEFASNICQDKQFSFLSEPLPMGAVDFIWVFLLEEFMLKLSEVDAPGIKQKTLNMIPWIREIRSINIEYLPG